MDFRIERRDCDQEADSSVENQRLQTPITPPIQPVLLQHPIQENVTTRTNPGTSDQLWAIVVWAITSCGVHKMI